MAYFKAKYQDYLYVVFRIGTGLLFFMFGIMKLFGLWGMPGGPAKLWTLIWFAGAAEFLIGLGLILCVFTRLASFFGIIEMIVAYIIGHALPNWWNPIINQGAPALMFMLAFIAILAYGARKVSLEQKILGEEFF